MAAQLPAMMAPLYSYPTDSALLSLRRPRAAWLQPAVSAQPAMLLPGIHELGSLINYKLVLQRTVYFSFFNLLAHNFSKQKSKKKFKGLDSTFTVEVRERERERVYSLKVSYIRLFTDITFCRAVPHPLRYRKLNLNTSSDFSTECQRRTFHLS